MESKREKRERRGIEEGEGREGGRAGGRESAV